MGKLVKHPGLRDSSDRDLVGRLVEIAGVDTYLYDHGEGPAVLLLHGYGDSADGWRYIVPELSQGKRVIAIDLPPFGRSADPSRMGSSANLVDFYRDFFPELFESLGIASATVVGHSLGGAIACECALEEPQLVDCLVVVAPAGLDDSAPLWWRLVAALGSPGGTLLRSASPFAPQLLRASIRNFISRLVVYDAGSLNGELEYLVDLYSNGRELNKMLRAGRDLIGSYTGDLAKRLEAVHCPTLGIWGRYDALVPVEHTDILKRASTLVETKVIENCGHYPQIEKPGQFKHHLMAFLDQHPSVDSDEENPTALSG